jgi:hypothetical protein
MSATGKDSFKDSYNPLVRQYWPNWADGFLDIAANPNWGADGASLNTTYLAGGLHWDTTISEALAGRMYSYAIRRMYGNTVNTGSYNIATSSPYLVQPEDIFWQANDGSSIAAYMIPAQFFTGQTVTVKNVGAGTLTLHPKPVSATITNLALTSNVVTITASNNFTAGDVVILTGLTTTPALNGTPLTINATSLSSSSFQAALTHANISSGSETGLAYDGNYCQIGAITNVAENASNVVTLTISNNFANSTSVTISGVTTATWLNGQTVTLTSQSSTSIQFTDGSSHGTYASAPDTGICVYAYPAETFNGSSTLTVSSGATAVLLSELSSNTTGLANWITLQNG